MYARTDLLNTCTFQTFVLHRHNFQVCRSRVDIEIIHTREMYVVSQFARICTGMLQLCLVSQRLAYHLSLLKMLRTPHRQTQKQTKEPFYTPITSTVQVGSDCTLQFRSAFSEPLSNVLQIVSSRKTKSSDKIPSRALQISVILFFGQIILRSTKIGIT